MMLHSKPKLLCVVFFCLLLSVAYSQTGLDSTQLKTTTQYPKKPKRLWNLKNVDIRTFINTVAEETGNNFAIEPNVKGNVTLISAQPLSSEELYQAFLSVLEVNGFVAIPDGKVTKIIPNTRAKGLSNPIFNEGRTKTGDEMAVAVVRVKYLPAEELARVLTQFVLAPGRVAAYPSSNDIMIADRAGNIVNLIRLVSQIDQRKSANIRVVRLRNAVAKSLVETLNTAIKSKENQPNIIVPSLAADERTNSILISGGSPEQRNQMLAVITSLDGRNTVPLNVTEVIYLKHLYAERIATIVNGLMQSYIETKRQERGVTAQTAGTAEGLTTTVTGGGTTTSATTTTAVAPMFSTSSALYTSNAPDNDIASIVKKMPQSGSLSPAIQWEESTNSLIVTAPPALLRKIKHVIKRLDIRRPQVLIEAVIAEVGSERQRELGIELNSGGAVQLQTRFLPELPLSFIGANGQLADFLGPDRVGEGLSATYKTNQIRFLLRALETDHESNVLATPNLVTLDNEPAQIKVGQKISFSTAQIQNNPTGGNPFSFFDRQDVGLVLTINPQITSNGTLKLLIQEELSTLIPTSTHAGGNPDTTERFIRTTVMAKDGEVLVLGGLLQNEWDAFTKQIPAIGNIPVIGWLFKDKGKISKKSNLMIFLRPTILYDDCDDARVTGGKYEYLRQSQISRDRREFNPVKNMIVPPALPLQKEAAVLVPPFLD